MFGRLLSRGGFAALVAALAFAPDAAHASSVNVTPTRLSIAPGDEATNLALGNEAATPVRFSVRAYTWRQLPDGSPQLDPTDDLIVFPQIVTIAPNAKRDIRIAYTGRRDATERDYRIIANELPADDDPKNGIALRTRFSIPLFLAPPAATQTIAFANARATTRDIAFDLTNGGSAHAFFTSLHARGLDARGATVFETDLPAWYLLPGEPRRYVIPTSACARLATVRIDGTLEAGPQLHSTFVPGRSC